MIERKKYGDEPQLWDRATAVNPSGIVITDPNLPDNPIVYANPGFEQLTGYVTEEVVGRNCRFLQGSDRDQPALEDLRIALREGRDCKAVLRNYKKDGTPFWNELSVSPLRDERGRLANFVGVQTDVTERKEAERRVAAQHTITRILAEALTLGDAAPRMLQTLCESLRWDFAELWTLDRQASVLRCIQTWNAPSVEAAEFGEVTRRHPVARGVGLPGRVWNSGEPTWITDVTKEASFPRVSAATKAGLRGAVAFPILLGGEVLGVVGFYSQEIREPDEEVLQMMSTVGSQIGQFIERKHTEEALQRSEQHLRSVVTNAPVILFALDHEGVFTLSEGKGLEALGIKPGQLVGSSALEIYRETPQTTEDIQRALAGEEFSAIMEMGGLIFETWFSPVLLKESGEVAGVIGVATDVTERKKAQEERERLSHQSELILNSAGEGIFGLDRQGRTRFANPAAAAMLGYHLGELIDRCQHDLIHHSHPNGSTYHVEDCPIFMALQDGIVRQVDDEVFWCKDGTSIPVEYTSTPILENGEVTGTVVIFSDITERRKAEEDLRKSEARLEEAQRIAHLGNWEWYINTGRVWWSAETYRIYGLEPGELVPTLDTVMGVFHPDDRHLLGLAIHRAFHEDEAYGFEHRIVRPDGEVRWVHRQVKVVHGEGEESLRLYGTIHDISEHKSVERELIEGARQAALGEDVGAAVNESGNLQTILQQCTEVMIRHLDVAFARIWILKEEHNELELQASAGIYTHLDGAHGRVPVGKFKIGLIAQERRPYLTNDVLGDPHVHDKEWARQEGMVAFAGYPLVVEDHLVGVVAMFARQQLSEATLNALASVAGTIAQGIVRKQAEENLRAYAARLNRSNRDLQDFAYVASHDLQEPLRKVRTFADRLNTKYAEVLGNQGRDYLKRMEGAAARMQDLIDDLLELSRVTTKAQPFAPVDLNEVVQEVVSDLEPRIDQIGGQVKVSTLPTVEADRPQMRQLMQNLIGNALKFHREEEAPIVRVYGELLQERKENSNGRAMHSSVCQILVEDNGIGFDEEHLDRIFVPFQRLHGRTAYEGTGMGLAICRKVAERHGGNITAKSAPGRGATFGVKLPVKQFEGNP